jgi:ABC-type nitrate/sulfonate/bicarbonate transport system substrate-binding protein
MLANEPATVRGLLRAVLKGHLFYGQKPEETVTVIQKFLRIEDRKAARETYEDEMRRYNPGGGFELGSMKKVIDRARETRKLDRKVEVQDVFDLSMAAEVEASLKKSGWKP